jgi:DNA repair exonuclease SbcCD ATPase subunit
MKPEIASIFGEALQQEVSTLLENLGGMTDIIEANFSQIKDILEKHKNDVIKAITQEKNKEITELKNEIKATTQEKNKEISELKNEIKAKDSEINNLKQKEGELKGKDDLIASLNRNIDKL